MIKRIRERKIKRGIKKTPKPSLSQTILAYGILLICIYFFIEIIFEFLEYFDLWSLRKMTVLFIASIVASIGFIIGVFERKKNKTESLLGIIGNLSLLIFYIYIIIQNGYYLAFV